jgi:trans-aconitate methyltransferase
VSSNPFDVDEAAAANYARSRPYYHPRAVALGFEISGAEPVDLGLDVGCGTGLSTKALAEHARHVIGIDPAVAMLSAADPVSNAPSCRQPRRAFRFAPAAST